MSEALPFASPIWLLAQGFAHLLHAAIELLVGLVQQRLELADVADHLFLFASEPFRIAEQLLQAIGEAGALAFVVDCHVIRFVGVFFGLDHPKQETSTMLVANGTASTGSLLESRQ